MNPRRVTEELPRSLDAQLLRAGRELGPSREQLGRTLAAVALLGAQGAKATSLALTIQWAATGLVSGVALVGAVTGARIAWTHFENRPPIEMTQPRRSAEAPQRALALAVVPGSEPHAVSGRALMGAANPPANANPPAGARAVTRVQAPNGPNTSLGQEVALIDRARSELGQHRAARALELLDDYARLFPSPRLAEEAAYLRVLALESAGKPLEATQASDHFRRRFPASPLLSTDTQPPPDKTAH